MQLATSCIPGRGNVASVTDESTPLCSAIVDARGSKCRDSERAAECKHVFHFEDLEVDAVAGVGGSWLVVGEVSLTEIR